MNYITDISLAIFKTFRLGNFLSQPGCCIYSDLSMSTDEVEIHQSDLPQQSEDNIRICILSDTHERHYLLENLPHCDILVHSGDIFMTGRKTPLNSAIAQLHSFNEWLGTQSASHRIVIGGNHDKVLEDIGLEQVQVILSNATYLCNTSVRVDGLNIWGTPLSNGASGNRAFQSSEFLQHTLDTIKKNKELGNKVDILITHGPCRSIGETVKPRIMHIFGHAHALHGISRARNKSGTREWYTVAAPIMDTSYSPLQLPIVVDISRPNTSTSTDTA